uniref:Uncharacterized protein n=1 Tax=Cyprinus carpio TaxID=7962 RepID=A0A8C2KN70_CYPCA
MALTVISFLCFAAFPRAWTACKLFTNEQISYSTAVIEEGLMFGAINQLFTYTIHKTYGIYLESVNGLAGSDKDQTYWELLSEKGGVITRLEVGT